MNKITLKMTYDEYRTLNEIVRIRESDFVDNRLDKNIDYMEKESEKGIVGSSGYPYDLELTFKIDLDDFFLIRKAIRRYRHSDENLCLASWYMIELDELLQSMRKQHKDQLELWKPIWKEDRKKRKAKNKENSIKITKEFWENVNTISVVDDKEEEKTMKAYMYRVEYLEIMISEYKWKIMSSHQQYHTLDKLNPDKEGLRFQMEIYENIIKMLERKKRRIRGW